MSARRSRTCPARSWPERWRISPWNRPSSPASRTTAARPRSPWSACRTSRAQAAALFRVLAEAELNLDMIVQNVSTKGTGRTDVSFTLPKTDGADRGAGADQGAGRRRLRGPALRRPHRQAVADRCRHALAPRRVRLVLRRAGRSGRQRRDDLHLGDPDLGRHPRHRSRRRGARGARRVRPGHARTSRPSCTAGPADDRGGHRGLRVGSSARPVRSAPWSGRSC